jgi:hypothetical protein
MRNARRDINSQTEKPKTLMKKTIKDGRDQFEALLEQRNTPRQDTGLSPVEMMFGRKTRTMLPFLNKCNETNRRRENRKLTSRNIMINGHVIYRN